jgi:hypothetical protein
MWFLWTACLGSDRRISHISHNQTSAQSNRESILGNNFRVRGDRGRIRQTDREDRASGKPALRELAVQAEITGVQRDLFGIPGERWYRGV